MAESAGAPVELTAPGRGQQSRLKPSNLPVFAGRREEKSSTTRVGKQALTRKGQAETMRSAWPFSLYPASNPQPGRLNTWAVRFPPTGLPFRSPYPGSLDYLRIPITLAASGIWIPFESLLTVILVATGIQSPFPHPTWFVSAGMFQLGRQPVRRARFSWHNRLGS